MQTSFTQWINALRRHWFLALLVFTSTIALTVTVILYYPRLYRSEAKLLLRVGRETVALDPTASNGGERLTLHQTREHEMQTALGVMHSETLIEQVIEQVGVELVLNGLTAEEAAGEDTSPGTVSRFLGPIKQKLASIDPIPEHERAVRELRGSLRIGAPSESSVVSVEYRAKSPAAAQVVVESWLENYISLHAQVHRTHGTYEFFADQDRELKRSLTDARQKLRDTKSQANLVTIEGQQKLVENELSIVRSGLLEVDGELAATRSRIEEFAEILINDVERDITEEVTGKANESRDEMRSQLFELETLEKDLVSKLKPGHPKLTAVRRQLSALQAIVGDQLTERKEVTTSINPAYQRMLEEQLLQKAAFEAFEDKREKLAKRQSELMTEVAELNDREREIQALSNEVEILELRYARHSEKLEQARLDEILERQRITSVNVVQPASLEHRPVTPNKKLCAILGLFAATLASLALPLLWHTRPSDTLSISAESGGASDPMTGVSQAAVPTPGLPSAQPSGQSNAPGLSESVGDSGQTEDAVTVKPR